MAPLFAVRQRPSFPSWQARQLGLFLSGFILFSQLFPKFLTLLQEQGWEPLVTLLLWRPLGWCIQMVPKLLLGLNTNLAVCFCGHTGIPKNPVVLLKAEENHSFLCREQSCSLFSKGFTLLSERWGCSPWQHLLPPGSTSWQHSDTQAPLICFLGNILVGTQGVTLWSSVQAFPPAGMFLSSGQRQGWPGRLRHHLRQTRTDSQMIPCTSQTLLEVFKENVF